MTTNKKMEQKRVRELDIGDPIEHWVARANKRTKALKLSPELINDSAAIVVNAVGKAWLEQKFAKPHRALPFTERHPIVRDFEIAGDSQIVAIMELAEYFRILAKIPGLEIVINLLKNNEQYSSAFLQLAYAYRFLKLGATHMEFEPPVDEGRHSDIFFRYKNTPFLVECFCPEYTKRGEDSFQDIISFSIKKLFDAAKRIKKDILFHLIFSRDITNKERKQTINICIQMLHELASRNSEHLCAKHEFCHIHLYDANQIKQRDLQEYSNIIKRLESQSDLGCNSYLVARDQLEKVRDSFQYERIESSRLYIKRPVEDTDPEWVVVLGRKIEGKIAQVRRRSDTPRGVLIVRSGIGLLEDEIDLTYARRLQYKILKTHENLDAVILSSHKWMVHQRYQLIAALLLGSDTILFGIKEVLTMNFLEDAIDLLRGWPALDPEKFINTLFRFKQGLLNKEGLCNFWSDICKRNLSENEVNNLLVGVGKFFKKLPTLGLSPRRGKHIDPRTIENYNE